MALRGRGGASCRVELAGISTIHSCCKASCECGMRDARNDTAELLPLPVDQLLRLLPDRRIRVLAQKHARLVPTRALRLCALRLVDVSPPSSVDPSVGRLEHRFEFGFADEERAEEGEGAELGCWWPVKRGGEEALRKGECADGGRERARDEEDGRQGAEEEIGFGLGELVRLPMRERHRVLREVWRLFHCRRERERENKRVERRDKVAEVDDERFA